MPVRNAKLEKARLKVVDGEVDQRHRELKFTFNPSEYSIAKSASWHRPKASSAKSARKPQFTGTEPQTLTMEIFFDAWETANGDVSKNVETLIEWTKPTKTSVSKTTPEPPIVAFLWGDNGTLSRFRGFLKSVSAKYTMFREGGTPVRATANITLSEVPHDANAQNPTSGSIHTRRSHVMTAGDSLASIAYREYGDATMWRGLAAFNNVDDPLRLPSGTRLLIPSAAEAARLS